MKEIEDNPLLRNLGLPVPAHGSEGRIKGKAESQPLPPQPGGQMAMPPSKKAAVSFATDQVGVVWEQVWF